MEWFTIVLAFIAITALLIAVITAFLFIRKNKKTTPPIGAGLFADIVTPYVFMENQRYIRFICDF